MTTNQWTSDKHALLRSWGYDVTTEAADEIERLRAALRGLMPDGRVDDACICERGKANPACPHTSPHEPAALPADPSKSPEPAMRRFAAHIEAVLNGGGSVETMVTSEDAHDLRQLLKVVQLQRMAIEEHKRLYAARGFPDETKTRHDQVPLTEWQMLVEALDTLATAADNVGVEFFDTDTLPPAVEKMQNATLEARQLLRGLAPTTHDEPAVNSKTWREIQYLRGSKARLNIELGIVEQLLDGEREHFMMDYWTDLHDKLLAALSGDRPALTTATTQESK